ncbi:F-box only protein 33 isoform X2 [Sitophilus oryzae]|uniref:F-box only protein 33 isoform X2 n=1 Tax=Sitophilus oryzae TaxID=7048 RepID=A0A6J2YNI8_SITOR|nr:F-box only protein 33 isoform X2 [Sitophilus oryzae]
MHLAFVSIGETHFFIPSEWWPSMKFKIEHDNIKKAKFYTFTFGQIVSEATVSWNSLSDTCIQEFILLLKLFNKSNHLKSLILEPTHCRIDPQKINNQENQRIIHEILDLIIPILPKLNKFSLGCVEDLAYYTDYILRSLNPVKVNILGLASIKDDPLKYEESYFDPQLILPFKALQILSIDYDYLSDALLSMLEGADKLQRLVVHLHKIRQDHEGTTNRAWINFKKVHPQCLLRLSLIHAYDAVENLHLEVLREEMPLSHIKAFFCENVNMEVLHSLSTFYANTLQSVVWIDSLSKSQYSWKFSNEAESPDPFVLMSWLCSNFEELVLYGYKYSEENLIAIGRLRGPKMKRLEIPASDILFSRARDNTIVQLTKDISKNLQRSWNPLYNNELHPVIHNPVAGDSDEFLLPLVLKDLY